MKAISLFTGAGGMDYGFEAAGFDVAVAVEIDDDAVATLKKNRPHVPVLHGDIHDIASEDILRTSGLREGEASLLLGGPPCQPFSKASYWAGGDSKRLDDPRADTLYAYFRVVRDTLPEVFILENVHGIAYSGKEEGLLLIEYLLEHINSSRGTSYTPYWQVLDAADFGVPQLRRRFFMVAHRDGGSFRFPPPTHSPSTYTTAWDALGDLAPDPEEDVSLRGKWANLLPSIPEGKNYLWHTSRGGGLPLFGWRTRYWNFLLKLAKARPSWTITANPGPSIGPFHWKNRLLSIKELAALQTFPPNTTFVGGRRSVQRQIGNAVPSLLAEQLGRSIAHQLLGQPAPSAAPILAVQTKRPIPPPEPVQPVPTEYLHLVGSYPDHPGAGRGPRGKGRPQATVPPLLEMMED